MASSDTHIPKKPGHLREPTFITSNNTGRKKNQKEWGQIKKNGVNSLLWTINFRNVINLHGKTFKDTIFRSSLPCYLQGE
jgi:hypothetical protein